MDTGTFNRFRTIVYEKSGIAINANKIALVTARVGKRMRELSIENHKDYLHHVLADESGEEMVRLLDCISTNVTSFFRENDHFVFLADAVRRWLDEKKTGLRFWSAASSTGEEPYSLAMTVLDAADDARIDVKILGTDISTKVLDICRKGAYDAKKAESVPPEYRTRFFDRVGSGDKGSYEVKEAVKRLVSFARLNLSQPPFPMKGPFDAVFCRNVMIYFDNTVRKGLLDECYRMLKPGGYLFVGHAETLTGILSEFKPVAPSIYIKG
jgi:chemotaxis protein methyltransferase CheR